jgi:hypothetical protein
VRPAQASVVLAASSSEPPHPAATTAATATTGRQPVAARARARGLSYSTVDR